MKGKQIFITAFCLLIFLLLVTNTVQANLESTEIPLPENAEIKNRLLNNNYQGCNSLEADQDYECLRSDIAGMTIYEYDDFGQLNREIIVDNYINHFPNPTFKYSSGNLGNIFNAMNADMGVTRNADALTDGRTLQVSKTSSGRVTLESEYMYLNPHTNYTFSYYAKPLTGSVNADVRSRTRCYDDVSLNNMFEQTSTPAQNLPNEWTRYQTTISYTNVIACKFIIVLENLNSGQSVNIDNVQLEESAVATDFFGENTFVTDTLRDKSSRLISHLDPSNTYRTYTYNLKSDTSHIDINNAISNGYARVTLGSGSFATALGWSDSSVDKDPEDSSTYAIRGEHVFEEGTTPFGVIRPYVNYDISFYSNSDAKLRINFYDYKHEKITGESIGSFDINHDGMDMTKKTYILSAQDIPLTARYVKLDLKPRISGGSLNFDDLVMKPEGKIRSVVENELTTTGLIQEVTYADALTDLRTQYAYDISDRVNSILTLSDSTELFNEKYSYDDASNLIQINYFGNTANIQYDSLHRIKTFDPSTNFYPGATSSRIDWTYDSRGNTATKLTNGVLKPYSYDGVTNKLVDDGIYTYSYNDFGAVASKENINTGQETLFHYTKDRKLKEVVSSDGPKVEYVYKGTRIQRVLINDELSKIHIYGPDGALSFTADFGVIGAELCDVDEFNYAGNTFSVVKDGETKAEIDNRGYMILSGQVYENQADLDSLSLTGKTFDLQGPSGRIAIIDENGDLYLSGSLSEYQEDILPDTGRNFIVRKGEGENVLIIDSAGNLNLKGCVSHSGQGDPTPDPDPDPTPDPGEGTLPNNPSLDFEIVSFDRLQSSNVEVLLEWNYLSGVDYYQLWLDSNEDGNYAQVKSVSSSSTSTTHMYIDNEPSKSLERGDAIKYRLKAIGGTDSYSEDFSYTVRYGKQDVVGIEPAVYCETELTNTSTSINPCVNPTVKFPLSVHGGNAYNPVVDNTNEGIAFCESVRNGSNFIMDGSHSNTEIGVLWTGSEWQPHTSATDVYDSVICVEI